MAPPLYVNLTSKQILKVMLGLKGWYFTFSALLQTTCNL